jgi:CrcB protein
MTKRAVAAFARTRGVRGDPRSGERGYEGKRMSVMASWLFGLLTHKIVLLSLGGAVGTCARYYVSIWIGAPSWARGFPVGTFVVNVSGSFILGAAAVIIRQRLPPEYGYLYLLIGTGFCGGYTTFSTFEYETFQLVNLGSWLMAFANVALSVLAGFAGVVLAILLVNFLLLGPR